MYTEMSIEELQNHMEDTEAAEELELRCEEEMGWDFLSSLAA